MSGIRDIPGPSKRKAREENLSDALSEFLPFKKFHPDDEPTPPGGTLHEKWSSPKPRFSYLQIAPEEGHNLPTTLNEWMEDPLLPNIRLYDTFEAWVVFDCPRFAKLRTRFWVFDVHKAPYNMQLSHRINGPIDLAFTPGWIRFVGDHHLEAGDQISFDKNLDTTISDDFYYILNFVKNPKSSKKTSDDAESSKKLGDDAENRKNPSSNAESCKKTGEDAGSSSSAPDLQRPVFKVVYHRILLETPPYREQRNVPRPGSRPFQLEAICLSKTLSEVDVGPLLIFDVYDAIVLTDNPKIAGTRTGDIGMEFVVYDRDNRKYKMKLENFMRPRGRVIGFCLEGWGALVRNQDLRKGDRVAFYKFLDRPVSKDYYYVVLKLPADVDHRNRRNPIRPGSRPMLIENHCFTKIISPDEVSHLSAGLRLEALQARHFESNSRSLNETFVVFDVDDRQYDMKLSYFFNRKQGLMCFLDNDGWHSFVKNHNLKPGYTVHVYKILDQSVRDDHYFVIRHIIQLEV